MRGLRLAVAALLIAALALAWACAENEEGVVDVLNNDEIQSSLPMSYDVALAAERGLANEGGFSQRYFELQAYYAEAIWNLLDQKCNISKLDAYLSEADLRFIPCAEPVSAYQRHWSFGASFLFLRNNLHVERLSPEQLGELEGYMRTAAAADEAVQSFVQQTLRSVICIYSADESQDYDVVYEMSGKMAPNGAIVLGLATSPEYDADGNYVDAENEARKYEVLSALAEHAGTVMTKALGNPVRVFVY